MSTDWINRGILLAMVVLVASGYLALYDYASPTFRLYVPFGMAMVLGLVIYDVVRHRKPPRTH